MSPTHQFRSARPEYRGQRCQDHRCGRRPTGPSAPGRTGPGPRHAAIDAVCWWRKRTVIPHLARAW